MMGYFLAGVLVLGIIGTVVGYNKGHTAGVAATIQKMQVLIGKGTERRDVDFDKLKATPPDKLDEELRKLCEMHKKPEQTCAP